MQSNLMNHMTKLESRYKYALSSAFFIALFSQGMGLFNRFSVHDDAMNYGVGATYTSGRWMLDLLGQLEKIFYGDGHYSLSTFNGFLSIILIAFSACIIIRILDIRSPFFCMFIAGIMVCFPVITSLFGYMFTAHFYMTSLFLGTLGAYFISEHKKWYLWLAGIILITASIGIYQAFIPFIASLLLMSCIKNLLTCYDTKTVFKGLLLEGAGCVLSLLLYFAVNKLFLLYHNATLSSYMGIGSMGQMSIDVYLNRVIEAYAEFFQPNSKASYYMYPGTILYIYYAVIVISVILCVILTFRLARQHMMNAVLFVALILLLPLFTNLIFVMTDRRFAHTLMVYAQLLPFVFFTSLVENTQIKNKYLSILPVIAAAALLLMYSRVDNKCYTKTAYTQQEAISYFTSLATRIRDTDGYTDEMPLAFVNEKHLEDKSFKLGDYGAYDGIAYVPYAMDPQDYVNNYRWILFMRQWTGFYQPIIDAKPFSEMAEVEEMPSYPDDGSIKIIDNTIVIKF